MMPKKRHTPGEIISKLRQVDVLVSQGQPAAEAIRTIAVTEVLRDELLDGEIFYSLQEAKVVIESWRRHYNTIRPHASLGYKPPAPEVFVPTFMAWPAALTRPAPPARHTVAPRPTMH